MTDLPAPTDEQLTKVAEWLLTQYGSFEPLAAERASFRGDAAEFLAAVSGDLPDEQRIDLRPDICDRPLPHTPHGVVGTGGHVHHCPGGSK